MTGEVTLTGQVLPIGGLKEKSLAAQRAGIKQVIVPDRNEGDVEEISEQEREGLDFVYADDIGDVLRTALEPDGRRSRRTRDGTGPRPAAKTRSG
jgi:ATP-dependent Lon protease